MNSEKRCSTHARLADRCEYEPLRWPYGGRRHRDPVSGAAAITVDGLSVRYQKSNLPALVDVSLEVSCGQRVALVGHNGAGKSTLLKTLAGLLNPSSGSVALFGNPVGACHHRTAYLPQRADLDWGFPFSVRQLVMTGRYVHLGWFQRPGKKDHEHVNTALSRLDIEQLADKHISELSGGQQQRTLLARALVQESSLFLLDEPLNGVDELTRDIVDEVLAEHVSIGGTVLAATHDIGRLSGSFDRAVYLSEGRVERVEQLTAESKYPAAIRFTQC